MSEELTEEQLAALLRLKRFEQPPAQYFDRLLQDVHRRQRTDLLQRPLWKIAVERMQTFFSEHSMGHVSYAGAMAVVLAGGVTVIGLMTPSGAVKDQSRTNVAVSAPAIPPSSEKLIALQPAPLPRLNTQSLPTPQTVIQSVGHEPRYVIDARPVSYEPSSSFNF